MISRCALSRALCYRTHLSSPLVYFCRILRRITESQRLSRLGYNLQVALNAAIFDLIHETRFDSDHLAWVDIQLAQVVAQKQE